MHYFYLRSLLKVVKHAQTANLQYDLSRFTHFFDFRLPDIGEESGTSGFDYLTLEKGPVLPNIPASSLEDFRASEWEETLLKRTL